MQRLCFNGASRRFQSSLKCAFGLFTVSFAYADVTLFFEFEQLKNSSGVPIPANTLWAIVVAPPGSDLPGGLESDSSLSSGDLAKLRADFQGANITTGASLGDGMIMETGQLGSPGSLSETVIWSNEDFNSLQPGSLIGLYWFPGIIGNTTELPESDNFQVGGLQEIVADADSGGNAGMTVPSNSGQTLTIAYFDEELVAGGLPVSRFTAIDIPPSGYQIWRDSHFTSNQITAGDASSDADPDGDGLINLLEYATGHPPLLSSAAPLTLTRVDASSALLQFDQIADPELHYRVEATEDLALTPWPDVVFESSGAENVAERIERSQPFTSGQRFFRLQVDFVP